VQVPGAVAIVWNQCTGSLWQTPAPKSALHVDPLVLVVNFAFDGTAVDRVAIDWRQWLGNCRAMKFEKMDQSFVQPMCV
jgi:hypothetical protein